MSISWYRHRRALEREVFKVHRVLATLCSVEFLISVRANYGRIILAVGLPPYTLPPPRQAQGAALPACTNLGRTHMQLAIMHLNRRILEKINAYSVVVVNLWYNLRNRKTIAKTMK